MPRLTDHEYLINRAKLANDWFVHRGDAFISIPNMDQWNLHDYYSPTEPASDEAALKYRRQITLERPPLPQQAGKAFALITPHFRTAPFIPASETKIAKLPVGKRTNKRHRNVVVKTLVRPKVDVDKLTRAFVLLFEHDMAEQQRLKDEADKGDRAA